MTIYNPQLAELMNNLKNPPKVPSLRTFNDICGAMRTTHDFFILKKEQFEQIYSDAVRSGKLTAAGLKEMKEEFEKALNPMVTTFQNLISQEIEKWKVEEQKNAYAVVNKAPTEEQARLLEVIMKRDKVSQPEIEMWAKQFGDNYACSCAFRDFAKNKGFIVAYSDFTDAEERIAIIEDAYEYLRKMLPAINHANDSSYQAMAFFGVDENGEHYQRSAAAQFAEILDRDSTFKPQTIAVSPISEEIA